MKKYLMTGVAALAICAAFTSCSKSDELYDQGVVDGIQHEQKVANVYDRYNEAFINCFGQPSPNQTWGFKGYVAKTRNNGVDGAINVNGNQWTECPAVEVPGEVTAIFDYVKNGTEWMTQNNKPFATTHPENLNGYFVTQVRNGLNDDNNYTTQNGQAINGAGSLMNFLQIAFNENSTMAALTNQGSGNDGWEHINNFNASQNANHSNDTSPLHGNTKVENKGAYDFAYYNSLDSRFHNKWILVDGYNITSDHRFKDFYYVCFDFESEPTTNSTFITYSKKNDSGSWQTGYNAELSGTYWSVDEITSKLTQLPDGTPISDIKDITITRYLNGHQMRKGDNKYTDWIIRITKGAPEEIIDPNVVRIIAEDLEVSSTSKEGNSDFDFNDVVFDVTFQDDGSAMVEIIAAGGVYPLTVDGHEVHAALGHPERDSKTHYYKMINTGGIAEVNGAKATPFRVDNPGENGIDIEIKVNRFYVKEDGTVVDDWYTLPAKQGVPAAKICVDQSFDYCTERQQITTPYPAFARWATDPNPWYIWW